MDTKLGMWIILVILASLVTYNLTRFFVKETINICLRYHIVRKNLQKKPLPQIGGFAIALTALFYLFALHNGFQWVSAMAVKSEVQLLTQVLIISILGYGFLGLFEDVGGKLDLIKGANQHLAHLRNGYLSATLVRQTFGCFLALFISSFLANETLLWIFGAIIIVLYTNIFHLLRDQPTATGKLFLMHHFVFFFVFPLKEIWILAIPIIVAVLTYIPFEAKQKMNIGNIGTAIQGSLCAIYWNFSVPNITYLGIITSCLIITFLLLKRNFLLTNPTKNTVKETKATIQ
ncbi:hypothetical protein BHU72_02490 [Desulfuribacillus stibiiarsenatis]|uniref:Uncharacterized protein n=1 Tax=Desulfuribacillus stibiiarsenatis TaxID=1390249 RepID=A0A1E5L697_9FIRM|nr:hypothetical protein [Desulfuribacillus stibiiarsenatis]OEH85682.1 hypothetical protein BHU72_02490 [Desulfuribacillus stibiiarsenatis]